MPPRRKPPAEQQELLPDDEHVGYKACWQDHGNGKHCRMPQGHPTKERNCLVAKSGEHYAIKILKDPSYWCTACAADNLPPPIRKSWEQEAP
jgi:hypothetical protein